MKKFLIAAAMFVALPGALQAQDFFWSFSDTAVETTTGATVGETGTAYLFAAEGLGFNAVDLDFASTDSSVLQVTGGTGIDDLVGVVNQNHFNSSTITINSPADGRFFAAAVSGVAGVNPGLAAFDPQQLTGVGTLLASVDFSVVGAGAADLDITLGTQGVLLTDGTVIPQDDPTGAITLGTAANGSLTATPGTAIPEPSSAALLALGFAGLFTRRRR